MAADLKKQTIRGVGWSFAERFSVQGVQFLLDLIIARILTTDDYGLIGMLAIFMSISQVFIDGGFSSALIQKKDRSEDDYSTVFYINLGISVLMYLLLYFCAPYIASFYNQPILTPITRVYSLNLIIYALSAVNKVKLTVNVDFKTQSKISFGAAILSGIVGVFCAVIGLGVWALVVQMILCAVLNVILSFYYVRWWPKLIFSIQSFKNLFSFGSKLLIATLISSVYSNLYNLAIGKKFSSSDLGLYTRGDRFAKFPSVNIANILSRVSFPVLSQIQDDDDRLVNAYSKYIKMSAFVVFPLILGLCGVAKPLVHVLLTDKWLGCVPMLQILCFAYVWDCIILVNLNLLNVKGRSDLVLRLEVMKKSIAFVILFISLFFGLKIICLGRAVYSLIAFYLNTIYTKKILNYGFRSQFKQIFPYLALSIVIVVESLTFSYLVQNSWASLALSLTICPLTYALGCIIFKLDMFYEFMEIAGLGKIFHRKADKKSLFIILAKWIKNTHK